ncbi:VanZ family protein [Heyndrickxia ginsengihumi]|uniref:VanZ family protein n=1 Tax=Heyndrickxia ginsengihumi TaxID=363870 RepID=UPI003D2317E3
MGKLACRCEVREKPTIFARSFSLSLCFECLQFVFSIGVFDVDDLILNTSGGLLGYCAIKLYSNIVNTSSIIQDRDIVEKQEFKNIEEGEPYHK